MIVSLGVVTKKKLSQEHFFSDFKFESSCFYTFASSLQAVNWWEFLYLTYLLVNVKRPLHVNRTWYLTNPKNKLCFFFEYFDCYQKVLQFMGHHHNWTSFLCFFKKNLTSFKLLKKFYFSIIKKIIHDWKIKAFLHLIPTEASKLSAILSSVKTFH